MNCWMEEFYWYSLRVEIFFVCALYRLQLTLYQIKTNPN